MSEANNTANQLVVDNLALVGYHVNEHARRVPGYITRAELASAASLALVMASRAFDPERGVPFGRYASQRIRGAILDELRSRDWVSRAARQQARALSKVREELTAGMGRVPTRGELAEAMGTTVTAVDIATADADVTMVAIEDNPDLFANTHADPSPGPEESLLANEELQYLHAAIDCLPERLQTVVNELFFNDCPVTELAERLGVTQSRISQMRSEAISLLRDGVTAALDPESAPTQPTKPGVADRRRHAYFASVAARASLTSRTSTLSALRASRQSEDETTRRPDLRLIQGGLAGQSTKIAA